MGFKRVEPNPSFPELEYSVLSRWQREGTFEKSVEKNKGVGEEFVFYDGPPFPTGTPHHGTIFVSILKDVIPRYKTMRGYYVPRSWGWDCHGLPIETLAEKNLGISDKKEIEGSLGIRAFNDECRRIVSEFNESWKIYVDKLGRWVDFDNPYTTASRNFMESVIWSFSESYKKDLIYKDFRVNPYCYRCQTPLSISDTRLDDATRPKQDRAITVKFQVSGEQNLFFLAWTTTPWTLPSNLALCVGDEISYAFVRKGEDTLILAEALIPAFSKELGKDPEVAEVISGSELRQRGYRYQPLFSYFEGQNPNGFRVLSGDFVSTQEGTGIVHMAPAFGEDDYWTCRKNDISVIAPVDEKGMFSEEVSDFAGRNVHEANSDIVRFLKERGAVVRDETIDHNYPHCWRCRTPLIYKAVDAWYFSVEKIKEDLIKNNQEINWKPESVKEGRFGKWLENARDWNISRNRYWATPIPVWECDACEEREVLGSLEKLEAKAGTELKDLHKEFLDEIEYGCSKCAGTMKRVPEVLDGWYESGSMPYGQFHYPFEQAEHFRSHFPANFIVEYTGQLRGWFYYLHVLSTALFNKPAFQDCLVHGTLLAADGKKISKSQKNYTDPMDLMNKYGADALRAYLLSSNAVQMADLSFRDEGVEEMVKSISLPLWNALSFFTTYAEIDNVQASALELDSHDVNLQDIDRFILSEIELLVRGVQKELDDYNVHEAAKKLPVFLDTLNNWYIRRSRQRVWTEDKTTPDKIAFYATLFQVLSRFTQVLSPFCPFIAESVWAGLGYEESVHLSDWPMEQSKWVNESLSEEVALARRVISAGLSLRAKAGIRVRQPLSKLKLAQLSEVNLDEQLAAIREELNVKEIECLADAAEIGTPVGRANAAVIGPKYGKDAKRVFSGLRAGNFTQLPNGNIRLDEFELTPEEATVSFVGKEGQEVESVSGAVLTLDLQITEELRVEGLARDLVRQIQELRKEADFNIADRITLGLSGADEVMNKHHAYIAGETLSKEVANEISNPEIEKDVQLGDLSVRIQLKRFGH